MFIPVSSLASPVLEPSRFNALTRTEQGDLIVWNSRSGAVNRFSGELAIEVGTQLSRSYPRSSEQSELRKYLLSRGFLNYESSRGLNDLMIELDTQHYRNDLLQLILLPTEQCNFRCSYCYETFTRGSMSSELVASLKMLMDKRLPKLKSFHISWFGGEPLLAWDIVRNLTLYAREACLQHRVHFSANMTTNGSLLSPDRARDLIENGVTEYQITLDGPEETHNSSRAGAHGEATFQSIWKNLAALHESGDNFEVILRVNVDCYNVVSIPTLLKDLSLLLEGDGRFRILFRRVGEWGGENDEQLKVLDDKSATVSLSALKTLASSLHLKVGGGLLKACTMGDGVCYAARPFSFVIGSDGRIMKCTVKLDGMPENVVGQMELDGTMTIHDARMRRWIEPSYRVDTNCQSCQLMPNCQGMHCPAIRIRDEKSCCPSHKRSIQKTLAEVAL